MDIKYLIKNVIVNAQIIQMMIIMIIFVNVLFIFLKIMDYIIVLILTKNVKMKAILMLMKKLKNVLKIMKHVYQKDIKYLIKNVMENVQIIQMMKILIIYANVHIIFIRIMICMIV